MVVEVKPVHIRAHMVKCTIAGMVKLTALDMVNTTMNALASTITLALVPEEVAVQEHVALLVDLEVAELGFTVDIMDSNGTVSTIGLTHGTRRVIADNVLVDTRVTADNVLVNTQLPTQLMAVKAAEVETKVEDMDSMAILLTEKLAILLTAKMVGTINVVADKADMVDMAEQLQPPLQLPLLLLKHKVMVMDMKEVKEVIVNNMEKNGNMEIDTLVVEKPQIQELKNGDQESDTLVVEVPQIQELKNGNMEIDTLVVEKPQTQELRSGDPGSDTLVVEVPQIQELKNGDPEIGTSEVEVQLIQEPLLRQQ